MVLPPEKNRRLQVAASRQLMDKLATLTQPCIVLCSFLMVFGFLGIASIVSSPDELRGPVRDLTGSGNECTGLLTVKSQGRLGNQLGEYASLYAHAKRLNVQAVISVEMKDWLIELFPNISIPSVEDYAHCLPQLQFLPMPKQEIAKIQDAKQLFQKASNIEITKFPTELSFFDHYRDELLHQEFSIQATVRKNVDRYLHMVKRGLFKGSVKPVIFVGVHVRRTDYKEYIYKNNGGFVNTKLFFTKAMEMMRNRFPNNEVAFIIASDDYRWCKRMFTGEKGVALAGAAGTKLRGFKDDAVHFDFASLVAANHSIISVGTFGFWSAYLAGGDVIMAKGNTATDHELVILLKDYPLPGWQLLQDPCFDSKGRILAMCQQKRREYGL